MSASSLERFEHQVNALLTHFDRLKKENKLLREKQSGSLDEQNKLAGNQQMVASKIENLIKRLKSIASE